MLETNAPSIIERLRTEAMQCGVLVTLIDLFKFDNQGLSGVPRGLMELTDFEDVRNELAQGSHIETLVAFSRSSVVEWSKEATEALTKLSQHGTLRNQIIDRGGVDSMVDNLAKPDHALFAVNALLTLMKYNDAKERILNTKVELYLLQMVEKRIFDGTIHQEGIDILAQIFKNGDFRSMMLYPRHLPSLDSDSGSWNFHVTDGSKRLSMKYVLEKVIHRSVKSPTNDNQNVPDSGCPRNVVGILRKMLENTQLDAARCSAVIYLRIIVDYEDALSCMCGTGIVEALVRCLTKEVVDTQAVSNVLQRIAASHETLLAEIAQADEILVDMLSSHFPAEVWRMTTVLKSLSAYGKSLPASEI
ncbi:hypothetical protein EDB19DRAFT_1707960 [Suillus lakei]|nr:hypothetical protein EDB19DRAFT_1707960 [Suillus lakei]